MNCRWDGLPIVIFGIGGCARDTYLIIKDINSSMNISVFDFKGFVSNDKSDIGKKIEEEKIVTCNEEFYKYAKGFKMLGVAIALCEPKYKEYIEKNILDKCSNLVYPNLIHPTANISKNSVNDLGMGNIISSGVNFTSGIKLGKFININNNCAIGHDGFIENYCSINPMAVISGNVTIKKGSLIGAGASIKQKLVIGENSIVGLGAIVVKDVEDGNVVICKRAEKLKKSQK